MTTAQLVYSHPPTPVVGPIMVAKISQVVLENSGTLQLLGLNPASLDATAWDGTNYTRTLNYVLTTDFLNRFPTLEEQTNVLTDFYTKTLNLGLPGNFTANPPVLLP